MRNSRVQELIVQHRHMHDHKWHDIVIKSLLHCKHKLICKKCVVVGSKTLHLDQQSRSSNAYDQVRIVKHSKVFDFMFTR